MNWPRIKVQLEFKLVDCWVGAFWRWKYGIHGPTERLRYSGKDTLDVWICLLPMLPVHVTLDWRPHSGPKLPAVDQYVLEHPWSRK